MPRVWYAVQAVSGAAWAKQAKTVSINCCMLQVWCLFLVGCALRVYTGWDIVVSCVSIMWGMLVLLSSIVRPPLATLLPRLANPTCNVTPFCLKHAFEEAAKQSATCAGPCKA